jgi:hypothetical protein
MKSKAGSIAPQAFIHSTRKADERKLQILYEGLDSNKEGKVVSFFNELDRREELCSRI